MSKNLVSLCMIVKNEENCLERCLESAKKFVDEIIIVDTGSTDKTKEIARKYTNKVYDFVWCDDFSKARNYSLSKASGKYIMWLDADDYISPENLEKLINLRAILEKNEIDVCMLKYEIAFDSDGNSTFTYYRERIVKNKRNFVFIGAVHEAIVPSGKVEYFDIAIKHLKIGVHDPKRNLKIYKKLIKNGVKLNAREQYYFSRELYYAKRYRKAITELNRYLKIKNTWKEDVLGALEIKAICEIILKKEDSALKTLYRSFSYAPPRANFLCLIGDRFLSKNQFEEAVFWYKNALNCEKDLTTGGFVSEVYFDVYPALQLCVCYYNLGEIKKAVEFNNFVLSKYPNNQSALENDIFFKSLTY